VITHTDGRHTPHGAQRQVACGGACAHRVHLEHATPVCAARTELRHDHERHGSQCLAHAVGKSHAMELMITGRMWCHWCVPCSSLSSHPALHRARPTAARDRDRDRANVHLRRPKLGMARSALHTPCARWNSCSQGALERAGRHCVGIVRVTRAFRMLMVITFSFRLLCRDTFDQISLGARA
jgi:hypothetical protein